MTRTGMILLLVVVAACAMTTASRTTAVESDPIPNPRWQGIKQAPAVTKRDTINENLDKITSELQGIKDDQDKKAAAFDPSKE